jgi:hypothetical protein
VQLRSTSCTLARRFPSTGLGGMVSSICTVLTQSDRYRERPAPARIQLPWSQR